MTTSEKQIDYILLAHGGVAVNHVLIVRSNVDSPLWWKIVLITSNTLIRTLLLPGEATWE